MYLVLMSGDVRDLTYILKYVFLKIHEYKIICTFQLSVSPFFSAKTWTEQYFGGEIICNLSV